MSAIESVESAPQEIEIDLVIVLQALEAFGCADLFKIIKKATIEAEKRSKSESKPKKEDGPKKPTPPQFKKPKKWVDYTLEHANANGWEEFILKEKKEEIVMPASELRNGVHVHPGSGKPMTMTQAMSLSKQRYSPRDGLGSHPALYKEFLAWFDEQAEEEPVEEAVVVEKPVVIRKTAEQKAAEVAAKKAELEAANALVKAAREAAAEKKKQEKEAEKEAEKKRKAAEKAAAKAAAVPAAAVKPKVVVVVKAAAKAPVAAVAPVAAPVAAAAPVSPRLPAAAGKPKPVAKKPAAPAVPAWSCADDGNAHEWTFKGTKYLRNYEGEVWLDTVSGEMGKWCGVYRTEGDFIDESVADPYADEEENAEAEEANAEAEEAAEENAE